MLCTTCHYFRYFEVDHPFIFLVWDYYSGMLLLMGRVVTPEVISE